MKKNYVLIIVFSFLIVNMSYSQGEKFFLDFEGADPLNNLPAGVENVNGSNTVLVKGTDSYPAVPNAVQADPDVTGENELFLDFHGYLKMDLDNPSAFSIAYDYRRNDDNDDWWLGFLTFIGFDGTNHRLEQFLIREWSGQLHYDGNNTSDNQLISFFTNYHIVLTSNGGGVTAYVNGVEVLSVPYNPANGKNIHEWTDASLLMSFKGNSYDGTTVTPEPDFNNNCRDARTFVDNIALFDRELTAAEVTQLFNNGNNSLSISENEIVEISMYPNRAKDSNKITISNSAVKAISIYNILGAEVSRQNLDNSTFEIEGLSRGSYLVKCYDANGKSMDVLKLLK